MENLLEEYFSIIKEHIYNIHSINSFKERALNMNINISMNLSV